MDVTRSPQVGKRLGQGEPSAPGGGPLYERLPRGPHRLDRGEVLRHQRLRIHGAMVEAVADGGYRAVNVKQVTALAGVSRRSFYEQFSNKEDCYLGTFDTVAARWAAAARRACARCEATFSARVRAAMGALAEEVAERPKEARLALCETRTAGAAPLARLGEATGACERVLATTLQDSPDAAPLPPAVVRAIVGGAREIAWRGVAAGQARRADLAAELSAWFLAFRLPAGHEFTARLAESVATQAQEMLATRRRPAPLVARDERGRLLESVLRLALVAPYEQLSAPEIAEEAGVPLESFFALFRGRDECYVAAIEDIGHTLTAHVEATLKATPGDWPQRARAAVRALFAHLEVNPLHAHTLAHGALRAGEPAAGRGSECLLALAQLLARDADEPAACAVEGLAGALWRVVACQCESGRLQLLPLLADHVCFAALAPRLGAEQAAATLTR